MKMKEKSRIHREKISSATILRAWLPLTMVAHYLPSSLDADILKVVMTAFLVLLQRTALLVTASTVVTFVRFTHYGKNKDLTLIQCFQHGYQWHINTTKIEQENTHKKLFHPLTSAHFPLCLPWATRYYKMFRTNVDIPTVLENNVRMQRKLSFASK